MKNIFKFFSVTAGVLILTLTIGCTAIHSENSVIYNDNTYELCRTDFSVYGDSYKSEGFICYGTKGSPVFVEEKSILFDEGLVYHLADDEYPDISQSERIEKIVVTAGNDMKEIDGKYYDDFSELLSFENLNDELIKKADISKQMRFIEIYYKDYPAYQTTYMIVESGEDVGIMYCETATNTTMFGEDNMYVINGELGAYIKSLIE